MSGGLLGSAVVMGVLVAMLVIAILRTRGWQQYDPHTEAAWSEVPAILRHPLVWFLGFAVLGLGAVGGVLYLVTAPDGTASLTGGPLLIGTSLLVSAYLLVGTYVLAKARGHANSLAAAETATVFGALFLVAIAAQLLA